MPLYRLRQTGESTTLLPMATHIDIASAMALWIPRRGTSSGEYRRRMTTKVIKYRLLIAATGTNSQKLG